MVSISNCSLPLSSEHMVLSSLAGAGSFESLRSQNPSSTTSQLKRKRSPHETEANLDSSNESDAKPSGGVSITPTSDQRKKKRVTFVKIGEDSGSSSDEMDISLTRASEDTISSRVHKAFVQNAIKELLKKNSQPLQELASQLSVPLLSPGSLPLSEIHYVISAFIPHVDKLNLISCTSFIRAVILLDGIDMDPTSLSAVKRRQYLQLVRTHSRFLGILISTMPKWYTEVANRIVSCFGSASSWSAKRWHDLLGYLVGLVPTSSVVLQTAVVSNFPHKNEDHSFLFKYIFNVLQITEYCPELRSSIWGVILKHLVELDVDIENNLDELENDDDGDDDDICTENYGILFNIDVAARGYYWDNLNIFNDSFYDQLDDKLSFKSDITLNLEENETIMASSLPDGHPDIHRTTSKLDILMSLLIIKLSQLLNSPELDDALTLYASLLTHFTTYLLPTHRTHAIQYIFFHVSQLSTEFTDAYLALLLEITLAPTETIAKRQMAMQYLASYVARARKISKEQLRSVVSILCAWIIRYIDEREHEVPGTTGLSPQARMMTKRMDMTRFTMFYSVVQGIFYIFCFRSPVLRESDDYNEEWVCNIADVLQRVIITRFNPLKWCNQNVVSMFAKIARKEDAAYCFSIIEQNRRSDLYLSLEGSISPTDTNVTIRSDSNNILYNDDILPLEGYFPFDPIVLKNTRRIVKTNYISWDEARGDEEFSSEEEEEEVEDDASDAEEYDSNGDDDSELDEE
ncbi:RNA polymerase I-specific transcription initiation factor RRN3 [Dipodascopsis uninucleata]